MRVKPPRSITTPILRRERPGASRPAARAPACTLPPALALVLVLVPAFAQGDPGATADAPDAPDAPHEIIPADTVAAIPVDAVVTLERGWLVPDEESGRQRLASTLPQREGMMEDPGTAGMSLLLTGRFRHAGADTAHGLRVTLAVPDRLRYVPGSATGPGARIEYSIDGGMNFAPASEVAVAVPHDLTHIRWIIPGEFPPGTTGLVSFRAHLVAEAPPAEEEPSS